MIEYDNGHRTDVLTGVPDPAHLSTTELVRRAYAQLSTLVRDEVALAKMELAEKAKQAGMGAGLFGAAGIFAFFGVAAVVTTAILALSLVWPAWLAALTVAVLLFAIAAIVALIGRRRLTAATPVYPTEAAEGLSADIDAVRTAVHDRGRP